MADNGNILETIGGLVAAGVNWSTFKLEGTGTISDKQITVSVEVEELPKEV